MPQDVYSLKVRPGVKEFSKKVWSPRTSPKNNPHNDHTQIHRKPVRQPHSLNIHTTHIDQKGLKDEKNDHSEIGNRLATGFKYW